MKGKVERPIYESRLVSLLGQPEGLVTTAAQTLDYQFGFKVSETWFYRIPFSSRPSSGWILLQLGALLLSTTVVFIDSGEQALLERFGKPVAARPVLGPGAHFKMPWPIDRVYRYPTELIQTFNVGFKPDPAFANEKTILWTVQHSKEENFLVANHEQAALDYITNNPDEQTDAAGQPADSQHPGAISNQGICWPEAYHNEEPETLIQDIATREVVRYFVSVDFGEIMSRGRGDAANTLRDRIQAEANRYGLGANVIFVGLQDIHPPVKVAPDYEKVVAATHT